MRIKKQLLMTIATTIALAISSLNANASSTAKAKKESKAVSAATQPAKPLVQETLVCQLGKENQIMSADYQHNEDDIFLCQIGGRYFVAKTDDELNEKLSNIGLIVTNVRKASFLPKQKLLLIDVR